MELPCLTARTPGGVASYHNHFAGCFPFSQRRRFLTITASNNRQDRTSFGDQLLDYIEGGPKLRKWYGAPDQVRKDSGDAEVLESTSEEQEFTDEIRDAILVTNADSMTGQVGALANKDVTRGIEHIVFLSQFAAFSNSGGFAGLFNANARRQAEEDEAAIKRLGIPCTIIRSATLRDEPGGQKGFLFKQGSAEKGVISREDAAMICVKALEFPPKQAITFEVASGDDVVDDWGAIFESLNGNLGVQP